MVNGVRGCKARQISDQMSCARCGLLWDINDPDPPECKTKFFLTTGNKDALKIGTNERRFMVYHNKAMKNIREKLE